jgi:hypothetical protein
MMVSRRHDVIKVFVHARAHTHTYTAIYVYA